MDTSQLLSSDSHVVEPPDLWAERLPADLRDRGPTVRHDGDGDFWYLEGHRICSFTGGIQMGVRFDHPEDLRDAARFEEVRPGAYDPAAHLEENARDGVVGSVVNPSVGLVFFGTEDRRLAAAIMRAYNDWLIDFCSYDTKRLKGAALILLDDLDQAAAELSRCAERGLGAALIPVYPDAQRPYRLPDYDRFWAVAQDVGLPLGLHIGTNRERQTEPGEFRAMPASTLATQDYWVRKSLADLILSGVFERFERLVVGSVEHELGWAPYFIETLDYTYTQRPRRPGWTRYADPGAVPSDFFRRNVFISFMEDRRGLRDRDITGVDGLMWGSDYPHTETTFPRSQSIVATLSRDAGLSEGERRKVTFDNVRRVYGFDV